MTYTYERIIDEVGGFGKFQLITEVSIFSAFTLCSWSMMQMAFAGLVPDWYCRTLETDTLWNGNHTQQQSYTNESLDKPHNFQACTLHNGSDSTECKHFHFAGPYATVTEEWSLVCDHNWVRSALISVQMAGVLFGSLVSGQLSDQYGRRLVLNASVLVHALVNIAAAVMPNWELFGVTRFLIGFAIGGIVTTAFPYGMEFMPLKWRPALSTVPFWGMGVAIFAGVAYILPDWRRLHLACGALNLPCLVAWWLAPESVRWLTAKGKIDEAEAVFQKMAETNGKPLPCWTREMLETAVQNQRLSKARQERSASYLDLFRSFYLAKCTVVICFCWCNLSLIGYGIGFAVSSLAGNLFVNLLLLAVIELPGLPLTFWLMNRIGRRWTTVVLFSLACAASISSLVMILLGVVETKGVFTRWLALTTRVLVSCGWCAVQTWGAELYPTVTRNIGYGAANLMARVGGMLAPFLIDLESGAVQTYSILTALTFMMVVVPFTLTDTKDKVLSDHLTASREDQTPRPEPLVSAPGVQESL